MADPPPPDLDDLSCAAVQLPDGTVGFVFADADGNVIDPAATTAGG
jgi:hypothetical protein